MVTGAPVLPALAVAALTDPCAGSRGLLVAARRGRTLHALLDDGHALTPTGRVRRTTRPLCGRTPRAWRPAAVDGRPLCGTCSRVLRLQYGPAALATAATWLRPDDLADTIRTARDLPTVSACVLLLLESGHTGKTVTIDGHQVRLSALIATRRTQLDKTLHLGPRDHAWFSTVKNAPARRFPRRVS